MNRIRFLLAMAWREGRAARHRLLVLALGIAAGVAALVAVNAFADNVRDSLRQQAQQLLGADLQFRSRRAFPDSTRAVIDSAVAAIGGEQARVTTFGAMAYVPRTDGVRPVTLTAIAGGFPFYGQVRTAPAGRWAGVAEGRAGALVDSALLAALDARVGDTLAIGGARLPIAGTIANFPGDVSLMSGFSPRVVVPAALLDSINLLGFGSRADHEIYLRSAEPGRAGVHAALLESRLRPLQVRVTSAAEAQDDAAEALDDLNRFLGLVALVALLLGGLGTASAIRVLMAQKLDTVAVLRCLGASTAAVFGIYLLQAALLGALGGALGGLAGLGLQVLVPRLLEGLLPVDVAVTPGWRAAAAGLVAGVGVAVAFALLPLLAIRRVAPLAALRRNVEPPARQRDWATVAAAAVLALSVVGVAAWQAANALAGLAYAAGVGAALLVLWLAALGLVRLLRRRLPGGLSYAARQGVANLHRPGNQTVAVVMALGFGAFLLGTLVLVQHNLLRRFEVGGGALRANVVMFDIQADQRGGVEAALAAAGHAALLPTPIVPMRIRAVDGVAAGPASPPADTAAGADGAAERPSWAVRREYRSTWRDTLTATERSVRGRWPPAGVPRPAGAPVRVSVERDIAEELGVTLGSRITWDVQGVLVESEVAHIREVDWARFEPNFFVVFESGALEQAPHSWVALADVPTAAERGRLQRAVVERFPNVAVVDVSAVLARVQGIIDRVVLVVRFLATFSLLTGLVVLAGAVSASRLARIRETALLKTLGATRRQLMQVATAEYLALGGLAAVAGTGLALVAGWALARWVFRSPFGVPVPLLVGLALGLVLLTLLGGLWQAVQIARRTPREALEGG